MRRALALTALLLVSVLPANASAAKAPKDFYGVVAQGALGFGDAYMMREAGVDTLRFHLDWRTIQSGPGRCQASAKIGICNWEGLDFAAGLFAAFDVRLFPYLLNVPEFVDPDSNTPPIHSKADRKAWMGFVQALVKRYGRGGVYWKKFYHDEYPGLRARPVTHWEVWNEPSDGSYWKPKPSPKEYARLLSITGRAIHSVSPKADVVFAGLFGTPNRDNGGIRAFDFYRRAFARKGLKRHFDDVGVHPYGPTLKRLKTQMGWILEEMKTAGLRKRDIWVTEIAWSSSEPPTILGVGPEGQASLLKRSFKVFEKNRKRWKIAGLHWYSWQDLPDGYPLCEFCEKSGLVDFDRNPKLSYEAFKSKAG